METNNNQSEMVKTSEFNRFGIISMIILVIGCMGGIAVGLGAINYIGTLVLVVVPTMLTLSLLLAVAPMKWIINAGVTSVVIDIALIAYFLLT